MLSIVASSSIQQCHNDDDGDSNCPCQPHDDDNSLNKWLADDDDDDDCPG